MPSPESFLHFLELSGLLPPSEVSVFRTTLTAEERADPQLAARRLVAAGRLTSFQADALLRGKHEGLVLGSYVILDKLGEGGMGQVFKARHQHMERVVALKVLRPAATATPERVARFRREIMAAARLEHPHVVTAYDADEADGVHFLVMQHVEGRDLARLVKTDGPLPVATAVSYIAQAAEGLAYAHSRGVIHRDVKPSNLLLDGQGVVKVLDLGLARLRDGVPVEGKEALTGSGDAIGTIDYMSPEQARDTRQADERSDVYSLGCTLHYLLTGRPPFGGDSLTARLLAHRDRPAPSLRSQRSEVPVWLDECFGKMLAKRPEDRFQSAAEVIAVLQAGEAVGPSTVKVAPPLRGKREPQSAPRGSRLRRVALAAVVLVGCLVLGAVLFLTAGFFNPTGPSTPTTVDPVAGRWEPGPATGSPRGLIARPAVLPGVRSWQAETSYPRMSIPAVAWGPDGETITYGHDDTVRFAAVPSLRPTRVLRGHSSWVSATAWSPDGRWLATGGSEGTVRLWDASGRPGPVLEGHTGRVETVAWAPDGKRLASGGFWGDCTLRLWDLDGTAGPVLKHESPVKAISWAPDGKSFASASLNSRLIQLWNASDGTSLGTLGPLPRGVDALAWSPDGKWLASSGGEYETERVGGYLWDVAERKQVCSLEGMGSWINWLGWSGDGKLAAASQDGFVALFDPLTGRRVARTPQTVPLGEASWAPDGRRIVDSERRVWTIGQGEVQETAPVENGPRESTVAWTRDGKRLAVVNYRDGSIRFFDATGEPGPVLVGLDLRVETLAWTPDGTRFAATSKENTVARLWSSDGTPGPSLRGHEAAIRSIAWAPDGTRLATGGDDKTVRLWSADGTPGLVLRGQEASVSTLAWSPDGKQIASGDDNAVRLWAAADGTPGPVLRGHQGGPVHSIDWTPDGRLLASAGKDWNVRLWGVEGEAGPLLKSQEGMFHSVAWDREGKQGQDIPDYSG